MKRFFQLIASIILIGFFVAPATAGIAEFTGLTPAGASILLTCAAMGASVYFYNHQIGIQKAAVQVEIWDKFIAENIYKNNDFVAKAHNADENVLAGKVVHIPQSGAASAVVKNRSSLPATVTKRSDTDVTYALDEFTSDPRLIPNADTVELSYDKMASVMKDDMSALRQTTADNILISWAPATKIIRTTGAATAGLLPGATGNRKLLIPADLRAGMTLFNNDGIDLEGRYALLSANQYDQLTAALSESQYRDFSRYVDAARGVIGQLYGWNIMMRATVLAYDNASTPAVKAYGAAGAAADNDAVLLWHEDYVERALGETKTFNRDNDPQYYGDLMSFLQRMGGRIRRSDEKGVAALVQAATT